MQSINKNRSRKCKPGGKRNKSLLERKLGKKWLRADVERYLQDFGLNLPQLYGHLQQAPRAHAHSCKLKLDFLLPKNSQNK